MTSVSRIRVGRIAAAVLLALCGCAVVHQFNEPYERTPAQRFGDRWTGKSEDDVILRYGKPADTIALASGNRVLSFVRTQPVPQGATLTPPPEGAPAAPPGTAGTAWCERRFEIAKDTARVVRAAITGNSCNYDL